MRTVRRVAVAVLMAGLLAGVVSAGWLGVRWITGGSEEGPGQDVVATAVVGRRTLEQRVVARGVTGFVAVGEIRLRSTGWVSRILLEQGSVVTAGDPVAVVDGRVVVAVAGIDPLWRDLDRDVRGSDVEALQGLLVEAGLLDTDPDGVFGASTEAAWREWQELFGFEDADGVVRVGDLVVGDWPLRVGQVRLAPGDFVSQSGVLAGLTLLEPGVTIELIPSARLQVVEGAAVRVEVSVSGLAVWGVLASIADQPVERLDGGLVFPGHVVLDDELAVPEGTQTQVSIITASAEDVVVVPLASVISAGAGGTMVRVVDGDGTIRSVPVELGMSDGAWVEVVSGVEPGQTVVVAAVFSGTG